MLLLVKRCPAKVVPMPSVPHRYHRWGASSMNRYFTEDHEWIEFEGDLGTVGITDYAQGQLGDISFVDLPEVGAAVAQGDSVSVVDSVKAASDIYTPASG